MKHTVSQMLISVKFTFQTSKTFYKAKNAYLISGNDFQFPADHQESQNQSCDLGGEQTAICVFNLLLDFILFS